MKSARAKESVGEEWCNTLASVAKFMGSYRIDNEVPSLQEMEYGDGEDEVQPPGGGNLLAELEEKVVRKLGNRRVQLVD
ncbi:hypothetical protein HWV62_29507 [Athelia sp. TMB]|nr:hypothetical protein HWV62_29507 [Athelia sp. TMB]